MVKYLLSLFFISFSFLSPSVSAHSPTLNTAFQEQATETSQSIQATPPARDDFLDDHSPYARQVLQRAERILSTLVFDPESYHLMLSNRTSFGGEAVPPFVFSNKPTMILYQGALSPNRSNEEIAFMMAHELGHLNLHHMENMDRQMEKIFTGPSAGISGLTFSIFKQKLLEREADMFGLYLYNQAGYSLNFFPYTLSILQKNPNLHYGGHRILKREEPSSLSMKDSHFKMSERFEYLVQKAQKIV